MAKEISLKATVGELDKVTKELAEVSKGETPEKKKELELKINRLDKIREELIKMCGKTFPLYIPMKR